MNRALRRELFPFLVDQRRELDSWLQSDRVAALTLPQIARVRLTKNGVSPPLDDPVVIALAEGLRAKNIIDTLAECICAKDPFVSLAQDLRAKERQERSGEVKARPGRPRVDPSESHVLFFLFSEACAERQAKGLKFSARASANAASRRVGGAVSADRFRHAAEKARQEINGIRSWEGRATAIKRLTLLHDLMGAALQVGEAELRAIAAEKSGFFRPDARPMLTPATGEKLQ